LMHRAASYARGLALLILVLATIAIGLGSAGIAPESFRGEPLLLHINSIEEPICRECEEVLKAQTEELSRLHRLDPTLQILSVNLRKNPYSRDGRSLAEVWWGVNITWPLVEEFAPYRIAGAYMEHWSLEGGFSNPAFVLLDKEGDVVGAIHVYSLGKGEIDGIQSAELLQSRMDGIGERAAEARGLPIEGRSALGMFILGILTSFSPCSIALLIAVFSYLMTSGGPKRDPRASRSSVEGLMIGLSFTLGMALVFLVIGLFISQVGLFVRGSRFFDLVAGSLLIVMGFQNLKPLGEMLEPFISRLPRTSRGKEKGSYTMRMVDIAARINRHSALLGAFALGIFFSLGWAPCAISLVFPVIVWLISQDVSPVQGGMMLFIFGLGHGVPIIPIATFSRSVAGKIGDKYISAGQWITKAFGLAIIAVGLVFAARYFGYALW